MVDRPNDLSDVIADMITNPYVSKIAIPAKLLKEIIGFTPRQVNLSRKINDLDSNEFYIYEKYGFLDQESTISLLVGTIFSIDDGWVAFLYSAKTHLHIWGENPGEFIIVATTRSEDKAEDGKTDAINLNPIPRSEYGSNGDWTPRYTDSTNSLSEEYKEELKQDYLELTGVYELTTLGKTKS